jgi:hypothetical protein
MSKTAAHVVNHVIPHVPVRQRVLSLPIPLRLPVAAQLSWSCRRCRRFSAWSLAIRTAPPSYAQKAT